MSGVLVFKLVQDQLCKKVLKQEGQHDSQTANI